MAYRIFLPGSKVARVVSSLEEADRLLHPSKYLHAAEKANHKDTSIVEEITLTESDFAEIKEEPKK